ncbi:WD40 repeat domain-containing protein [Microcoleus sp. FACHB-672]|uniref:WD40 repeat domain-containing protein n=1 Tax=Microcoleus sp. FACHB-672 TaxID=2692825 RepID=UPI001686F114|nr:hypothetical protein [Microcoleus sp. FACHB-672]MBD2040872.1 hypothetical protein [Microcoleus sp. FACHB-672]
MKLLPSDSFTIKTEYPLPAVIDKLNAQIEPPKAIRWSISRNHAPYEGTINDSGFDIRRIIHYRNSFLPKIRGRFEPLSQGTLIHVTLRVPTFIIAFLLFWYAVWYSISIPFFLFGALSGDVDALLAFQFVGLPVLLLFALWCAFWYEANRSRHELTQIILGEPLGNQSGKASFTGSRILMVAVIILSNVVLWHFSPLVRQRSSSIVPNYCSQKTTQSPYCNFSVVRTIKGHPTASTFTISADGKTVVSGGEDKAIKIWDLQTGQLRKTLQSDSGKIDAVAIAPDSKTVVTGSGDRMVRIWDITSNQRPQILKGHSSDIRQVEISSDGKTIISSAYDELKMWDLTTGKLKTTLPNSSPTEFTIGSVSIKTGPPPFYPLAISSAGKIALVELDSELVVWDLATNRQRVLSKQWNFESIGTSRISLDGQTVVTTSFSSKPINLKVWDLKTGKVKARTKLNLSPNENHLSNITLSQDRIIAGTYKGLTVWNLQTAELEAILDKHKMSNLVISSDGKLLAGMIGDPYSRNSQIKILQRP